MKDLIVETELGRDPDDFFALCYLVEAGVRLRAVVLSPGDPDQIAVARTASPMGLRENRRDNFCVRARRG